MTTIITRLYANTAAAQAAVNDLKGGGHSEEYVFVIGKDGDGTVAGRMVAARVNAKSVAIYAAHVAKGAALVVVQAPFNPIGAARHAMRVLDKHPSMSVGVADENEYVREQPRVEIHGNILRDHPLFMVNKHAGLKHGTISGAFGLRLLSARGTKTSAIAGGGFM